MEGTKVSVRILADSTCDLPKELAEQYGITIIPLRVVEGNNTYLDGIDITADEVLRQCEKEGKKFGTTAVNTEEYLSIYRPIREAGDEIVHFTISSEMSSCYQNAVLAGKELGGVYVIDSRNLSTGIAQLAIDAALMAREGKSGQEIFDILEEKKKKLDVSFVLDTLVYLARGGRCSAVAAFGANLLQLKPCIEVKDGKMGVGKKYRGKLDKSIVHYIHDKLADVDSLDLTRIFCTDSGVSDEIYAQAEAAIRECAPFKEIIHTRAGCTVSSHCGPNTLGILFYRK